MILITASLTVMILITASHTVMILITASHTVMTLIIHASHTVMILIIHASHTVMRLIILASPTVIIPASHTDMSQSTINQPHPIIKLSSSYISLIIFLANTISKSTTTP